MKVRVRLFASLRELVGLGDIDLSLPEDSSLEEAWTRLAGLHPALATRRRSLAPAVNRRYADWAARLAEGDEIAFIPPVSGG
jgi:molybdopterin synthase sulfur carrier subunit